MFAGGKECRVGILTSSQQRRTEPLIRLGGIISCVRIFIVALRRATQYKSFVNVFAFLNIRRVSDFILLKLNLPSQEAGRG